MKEITVQIKVQEHGTELYSINGTGSFIAKHLCTVISDPVDSVQPEVKGFESPNVEFERIDGKWVYFPTASPKLIAKVPKEGETWSYYTDKYVIGKVFENHCELSNLNADWHLAEYPLKHFKDENWSIASAPVQRKSIGVYEGVDVLEGQEVYFVNFESLKICKEPIFNWGDWLLVDHENESKVYLDPKEANARLKEEVEKKAKDYKFSISECIEATQHSTPLAYAIQQVEKEYQVDYLTE